jgi:hypothetical protein
MTVGVAKYNPRKLWAVMCGHTLVPMLAETRNAARDLAKTTKRIRDMRPDFYTSGPIRVVRVTVSVHD